MIGAAKTQGEQNKEAAILSSQLGNVNQTTPYGSMSYAFDPATNQWSSNVSLSPEQQNLYNLQTQGQAAGAAAGASALERVAPTLGQPFDMSSLPDRVNSVNAGAYDRYAGGDPNIQSSVDPRGYSLYTGGDPNLQTSLDASTYGRYTGGDPNLQTSVGPASYGRYAGGDPNLQTSVGPASYGRYTGGDPNVQSSLDFSSLGNVPTAGDYASRAREVGDSLYAQQTQYLDPQFARSQAAEENRLANQGLAPNSEAYKNAMDEFNANKNQAYQGARNAAISASGAEQSRLTADTLAGRNQMMGQILAGGQFANQADAQRQSQMLQSLGFNNAAEAQQFTNSLQAGQFGNQAQQQQFEQTIQGLGFNNAAEAQRFSESLQTGQFANAAEQQKFEQVMQGLGFNNAAEAQQFANSLQAGTFSNDARRGAMEEQAYARQVPFQEAMSLYGLAQPQAPNFQTGGGPTVAPTDILGATQAQYGNALDLYNSQLQSQGGFMQGLMGLGQAGMGMFNFSDRRLKSNIEQIGYMTESFLPVYSYDIFGGSEAGVMADEVRLIYPEAVMVGLGGYDMVDYGAIPGTVEMF